MPNLAVTDGDAEMEDPLISLGAKIQSETPFGETPLIISTRNGSVIVVDFLLQHASELGARKKTEALDIGLVVKNKWRASSMVSERAFWEKGRCLS